MTRERQLAVAAGVLVGEGLIWNGERASLLRTFCDGWVVRRFFVIEPGAAGRPSTPFAGLI